MGHAGPTAPGPTPTAGTVIITTPGPPPARADAARGVNSSRDDRDARSQDRNTAIPIAVALALIGAIVWVPRWTDRRT